MIIPVAESARQLTEAPRRAAGLVSVVTVHVERVASTVVGHDIPAIHGALLLGKPLYVVVHE
jgi:hypothetical protein